MRQGSPFTLCEFCFSIPIVFNDGSVVYGGFNAVARSRDELDILDQIARSPSCRAIMYDTEALLRRLDLAATEDDIAQAMHIIHNYDWDAHDDVKLIHRYRDWRQTGARREHLHGSYFWHLLCDSNRIGRKQHLNALFAPFFPVNCKIPETTRQLFEMMHQFRMTTIRDLFLMLFYQFFHADSQRVEFDDLPLVVGEPFHIATFQPTEIYSLVVQSLVVYATRILDQYNVHVRRKQSKTPYSPEQYYSRRKFVQSWHVWMATQNPDYLPIVDAHATMGRRKGFTFIILEGLLVRLVCPPHIQQIDSTMQIRLEPKPAQ